MCVLAEPVHELLCLGVKLDRAQVQRRWLVAMGQDLNLNLFFRDISVGIRTFLGRLSIVRRGFEHLVCFILFRICVEIKLFFGRFWFN